MSNSIKTEEENDLKYKNTDLSVNLLKSGYHWQCYETFTGLMKKYYLPKSKTTEKSTPYQEYTPSEKSSSCP